MDATLIFLFMFRVSVLLSISFDLVFIFDVCSFLFTINNHFCYSKPNVKLANAKSIPSSCWSPHAMEAAHVEN